MSRQSNKNKKYALRKIGKYFGSCVVATVITLGGVAMMAPNVTVYASDTLSDGEANIENMASASDGYEVIIPKGKKYIRNDEIESHEPVLKEEGYNGRSFILPKEGEDSYFFDHPMSELFKKLYDKDNDGNVDDKYKNPEPVDNSHAGEEHDGETIPYRSEINPKYPHVVDSGLTSNTDDNRPGVWKYNPDGKYKNSNGVIDESDNIVVARKPFTVDENAEENVVKDDGSVVLSYPYRIHVNKGDHIDKKDDVYEVGTKPKVERTPIPFETTYKRDDSVPEGTEEEVTAGVNGEKVTTTTYELNVQTGEVTPNEPTSVTTDPVTRVVKKGTQPKVEKTPIPFETTYERDDSVPEGTEEEVTAGKNGETVKTTTYELNPTTGEVTPNEPTSVTTDPVTRVVKKGTQPKVEKTPIPFETTYERDDSVPEGTEEEVTAGKNGETVKTTTYELNPTTGEVTANEPTSVTTDPVTRVVKKGTQPKVEKTPIPFETTYERDDSVPEGTEEEVTAGKNGETVKTTTYELNPTTGEVTPNEPTTATTDPVTRVVKKGTQPKVEKTPIPFETTYKRDDSVPEGTEEEVTAGKNGETVKTTTYELNPTTGEVTANEPTSVTTDPVTRVVKKGTQPKVEKTPIPFETTYKRDDSVPEGTEEEVTAGKNGETVKTTTYELNPTTGEVTANEPTSVTTDPVTRVVKKGTQPKVEKTPIPFETRYEEDNSIPEGEEREVTAGVNGETVKTTTYELNPTTGEVTANEPTSVTTDPVTRVVKRGTQPKPGETPETPQPKPGETPETPQPKPGETPETPQPKPGETPETPQPKPGETPETPQPGQPTTPEEAPAQPGQPSEPEDQPDLKVAPPTIAIVEEPNKASFEVKAPKKDADTVKIIYPKSNGSGNEVLTLTKQPTGEWTLDKQPENVTLDKKTGTVTIPRESVVNKQKVKAQAKHKTSNYTPFVYAALSIEAANPEHPVTLWVDTAGKEIKEKVVGKKVQAGEIAGYKWLSSRLEEGILTHTFEKVANGTPILPESPTSHPMTPSSSPSTSTPEKPNKAETPAVRTVWRDENGKDLKVPSVDKEEAGEVPGYEFVESHREGDNLTVHVFRIKQAQTPAPKDQTPSPAPSKVSEQKGEAVATATSEKTVDSVTSTKTSDKAELPNTGTESNASLASAGIMTLLAGLGLGFFKKKEDEK